MKQYREEFLLSADTIDRLSELCAEAMDEAGADKKDRIRIRLSLEEILDVWRKKREGARVICRTGQRFRRQYIEFAVEGGQTDMEDLNDGQAFLLSDRLLAQAGLALGYSYRNGWNCLTLHLQKKAQVGQMMQLSVAILSAVALGVCARALPDSVQALANGITVPFFNMIMGVLRAISSPLIFLAVCWGIVSIGDLTMVGKIGKGLILRMVAGTFAVSAAMALFTCLLFPVTAQTAGNLSGGLSDIYAMILDIVPSDIVSPFLEGNALQIIFLGICIGVALLILGERVSAVQNIVVQTNEIAQFLMGIIGKLVPVFVFLSIFNLLLSDVGSGIFGIIKVFCIAIPGCLLIALFFVAWLGIRFHVSPFLLIKKMMPTFLIAITTDSSAAAFATNLETCEKELGIPGKVANFAIPLGQVIYKPGGVVGFFSIAVCMAEYYKVEITPVWLIMAVLTVGLLAMAAPPIPGGALSIFTIMFVQLGIPGEAVALAIAVNSLLGFFMTSSGLSCLQATVTLAAGDMGMLDMQKLKTDFSGGKANG